MRRFCLVALGLLALNNLKPATAVTVEQIISRENPSFTPERAQLSKGLDGKVYLVTGGNTSWVLRMMPDGSQKTGGQVDYAASAVTASSTGQIAASHGHFAHKVGLYHPTFARQFENGDFLVSDAVGWDAPRWVEAAPSGDFYAVDQHRDRILRLTPTGKIRQAYAVKREPAGHGGLIEEFRVNEAKSYFLIVTRTAPMRAVNFDGTPRWTLNAGNGWNNGGFDFGPDGRLYTIESRSDTVKIWNENQPAGTLKLAMPEALRPMGAAPHINALRIIGESVVIKRPHPIELYQRYALADGTPRPVVEAAHERLSMTYPNETWQAGAQVPFALDFQVTGAPVKPQWKVWAQPMGVPLWSNWPLEDGKISVPPTAGGIYQIKVSSETQPRQSMSDPEYVVRSWVEVRAPGATGSLNVLMPQGRVFFPRGEALKYTVLMRGGAEDLIANLTLTEYPAGKTPLFSARHTLRPNTALQAEINSEISGGLRPGTYILSASAPGFTSAPHYLIIGQPLRDQNFHRVRHGDYGETYPTGASVWEGPDHAAAHAERMRALGFNLLVDRLGTQLQINNYNTQGVTNALQPLVDRLRKDPAAVAPEKVTPLTVLHHTMDAYSAHGIHEMAILMMMDAGLPLGGPGFDNRKPDQLQADIRKTTNTFLPYPSFRGWSWHSNWWIYDQRGANAARNPEEKAAYEAAVKAAKDTGAWNPVLDTVSNRRLGYAVEAQELFNRTLQEITPDLVTASAGTYRNVESYPPISFSNVDEVDLQGQFEQIMLPYFPAHAVDFYRRPNKPVWGHPEIWNDTGTGDQVVPTLLSMLMRGTNGAGPSGKVPPWTGPEGMPEDSRQSHQGYQAVFRSANEVLKSYGGWFAGLDNGDQIVIPVSGRQMKIDEWATVAGKQFNNYMEAWVALLHAGHPASYAFAEDLKPDALTRYKAVVLVSQWIEMEPALKTAVERAKAAGIPVFYDGASRAGLMQGYQPLGVTFDGFAADKHPASDDAAYARFPQYVLRHVPVLQKVLDPVAPRVIRSTEPEIMASQRTSGRGRFIMLVNNTAPAMSPGMMWRTTLLEANKVPLQTSVGLPTLPAGAVVYDVFSGEKLTPAGGQINLDFRNLPARMLAILPTAIAGVNLQASLPRVAGDALAFRIAVRGGNGQPVDSTLPVRLRLLSDDGEVLEERILAVPATGISGRIRTALNGGMRQTLQAVELISGQGSSLPLITPPTPSKTGASSTALSLNGKAASDRDALINDNFGLHVRELVLLQDGETLAASTMNWDQNLILLGANDGKVKRAEKLGSWFAFGARPLQGGGLAVQGFDFTSAEGYHLYLAGPDGKPQRRFALYGMPGRLPHRFVPGLFNDRINQFVVAPDGSWVASAGNLGLAVWSRDGQLRWSQDWWKTGSRTGFLTLGSEGDLLFAEGMKLWSFDPATGQERWQTTLAASGEVRLGFQAPQGRVALVSTTDGGRVFLMKGREVVREFPTGASSVAFDTTGNRMAVVWANQLKLYTVDTGLSWTFNADDTLRSPKFSPDGTRLASVSDLGTLYLLSATGEPLATRDLGGTANLLYLPGGDLVSASWMGRVERWDGDLKPRWKQHLVSTGGPSSPPGATPAAEGTLPTTRIAQWSNALPQPLPQNENLLNPRNVRISFAGTSPHIQFIGKTEEMVDGNPAPPAEPWLHWWDVGSMAETSPVNGFVLDTYRSQLKVNAITLVEDPAHPESWLRDFTLQRWDPVQELWVDDRRLLSNSAVHSHQLNPPMEASRFKLLLPRNFYGNLRLGEIVLHGESLGNSHPDALAKKPLATLFDDGEALKETLVAGYNGASFKLDGAFKGGRFIQIEADKDVFPWWRPPFGHVIQDWDFEIAENPGPGQYRYLQFAWKALSPQLTTGITLRVNGPGGAVANFAGQISPTGGFLENKLADAPPMGWQVQTVDLWNLVKKPFRIQAMSLAAKGGPAGFDAIYLARTRGDLPAN